MSTDTEPGIALGWYESIFDFVGQPVHRMEGCEIESMGFEKVAHISYWGDFFGFMTRFLEQRCLEVSTPRGLVTVSAKSGATYAIGDAIPIAFQTGKYSRQTRVWCA